MNQEKLITTTAGSLPKPGWLSGAERPWASWKLRGEDRVAVSVIGDGGASLGEWHETANFAAAKRLAMVFVIENNGWALGTHVSEQTACRRFALRAQGYGMPGVTIFGNDPDEVAAAAPSGLDRNEAAGLAGQHRLGLIQPALAQPAVTWKAGGSDTESGASLAGVCAAAGSASAGSASAGHQSRTRRVASGGPSPGSTGGARRVSAATPVSTGKLRGAADATCTVTCDGSK